MRLKITIEDDAKFALKNICSYVEIDSKSRAIKLKRDILNSIKELVRSPEKYPPDKYNNQIDGSVRAYELHHLRITYLITETHIVVLRIRHTKRNPIGY